MSEHSQYVIEWQKKNPEKLKAHQNAQKAGRPVGSKDKTRPRRRRTKAEMEAARQTDTGEMR